MDSSKIEIPMLTILGSIISALAGDTGVLKSVKRSMAELNNTLMIITWESWQLIIALMIPLEKHFAGRS